MVHKADEDRIGEAGGSVEGGDMAAQKLDRR